MSRKYDKIAVEGQTVVVYVKNRTEALNLRWVLEQHAEDLLNELDARIAEML